ncbi:unnamed protein product [Rotaria sordida]|uniref:Uncharacterized protein n=1 Tax=Rotaria sordida TaxID=392033 RepID=A0A815J8K9_9BILA|nr:unnamed protein product [Rotaria sordida]
MSNINIDDVKYVSSNETGQTQKASNVVTMQPAQRNCNQINTRSLESYYQYQTMPSSFYHNSETIPVTAVHHVTNHHHYFSENIYNIHEYTIWSVFNLLFCCLIIGAGALSMSCKTRKKKRYGDLVGAQNASRLAAILNIVATFSGIVTITLLVLRFSGRISM